MSMLGRHWACVYLLTPLTLAVWWHGGGTVLGGDGPQRAEDSVTKVENQVERSEKKEGKHDLVPDTVTTKTTATGEAVIEQVGEASFYGKGFHGKATASGEKFDQGELTAAHPTLPLGTEATVTNLETGKAVEVEITDRGPYAKGRDIDLSKRAAAEIGLTRKRGEAPVKIEAVVPPAGEQAAAATDNENDTEQKRQ